MDMQNDIASGFLDFEHVEARLVEAVRCVWRMPDREEGWLRIRAFWPEIVREAAVDYDPRGFMGRSSDIAIRPLPATRRDVTEMEEAFGWLAAVDGDDRRIVGLAITALAAGHKQVPWLRLLRQMGLKRGAHGLRKRYGRAMHRICIFANGGNASAEGLSNIKLALAKISGVHIEG